MKSGRRSLPGMCDVDGTDPFTSEHRLCDDEGLVTGAFLELHNRLRAMRHAAANPVLEPFRCTSHAHLAAEHIRCTSPAHDASVQGWVYEQEPTFPNLPDGVIPLLPVMSEARARAWRELTAAVPIIQPVQAFDAAWADSSLATQGLVLLGRS